MGSKICVQFYSEIYEFSCPLKDGMVNVKSIQEKIFRNPLWELRNPKSFRIYLLLHDRTNKRVDLKTNNCESLVFDTDGVSENLQFFFVVKEIFEVSIEYDGKLMKFDEELEIGEANDLKKFVEEKVGGKMDEKYLFYYWVKRENAWEEIDLGGSTFPGNYVLCRDKGKNEENGMERVEEESNSLFRLQLSVYKVLKCYVHFVGLEKVIETTVSNVKDLKEDILGNFTITQNLEYYELYEFMDENNDDEEEKEEGKEEKEVENLDLPYGDRKIDNLGRLKDNCRIVIKKKFDVQFGGEIKAVEGVLDVDDLIKCVCDVFEINEAFYNITFSGNGSDYGLENGNEHLVFMFNHLFVKLIIRKLPITCENFKSIELENISDAGFLLSSLFHLFYLNPNYTHFQYVNKSGINEVLTPNTPIASIPLRRLIVRVKLLSYRSVFGDIRKSRVIPPPEINEKFIEILIKTKKKLNIFQENNLFNNKFLQLYESVLPKELYYHQFIISQSFPIEYYRIVESFYVNYSCRKLKSDNIVKIIGFFKRKNSCYLLYEYFTPESLHYHLFDENGMFYKKLAAIEEDLNYCVYDLLYGIMNLHETIKFVHGFLNSRFIFFDQKSDCWKILLTPIFYLFNTFISHDKYKGENVDWFFNIFPEYFPPERLNFKIKPTVYTDVYSLSILLYEIWTQRRPYIKAKKLFVRYLKEKSRGKSEKGEEIKFKGKDFFKFLIVNRFRPKELSNIYKKIITESSWKIKYRDRMSMEQILQTFRVLNKELIVKKYYFQNESEMKFLGFQGKEKDVDEQFIELFRKKYFEGVLNQKTSDDILVYEKELGILRIEERGNLRSMDMVKDVIYFCDSVKCLELKNFFNFNSYLSFAIRTNWGIRKIVFTYSVKSKRRQNYFLINFSFKKFFKYIINGGLKRSVMSKGRLKKVVIKFDRELNNSIDSFVSEFYYKLNHEMWMKDFIRYYFSKRVFVFYFDGNTENYMTQVQSEHFVILKSLKFVDSPVTFFNLFVLNTFMNRRLRRERNNVLFTLRRFPVKSADTSYVFRLRWRGQFVKYLKFCEKRFPNLEDLEICSVMEKNQINDENIKYFRFLKKLHISGNVVVKSKGISELENNLESLFIDQNNQIDDEGIVKLRNLRCLSLTNNDRITDIGIESLGRNQIRVLKIGPNQKITNNVFQFLGKGIQVLKLYKIPKIRDLGLKNLSETVRRLELIELNITDRGIMFLEDHKSLRFLSVSGCREITNEAMKHLPQFLKELDISFIGNISKESFQFLHNYNLESLSVRGDNENISDEALGEIPKQIRHVDISGNSFISNKGMVHLSELKSLVARGCSITDEGLNHLKSLVFLDIKLTIAITNFGLENLSKNGSALKELSIQGNPRIDEKGIEFLNETIEKVWILKEDFKKFRSLIDRSLFRSQNFGIGDGILLKRIN